MSKDDFEYRWRLYINTPDDERIQRLTDCLGAATTIAQMKQIFEATLKMRDTDGVRSPTIKKMIGSVTNLEEAREVHKLATRRYPGTSQYYLPTRAKEAIEMLAKFEQAS